TAPSCSRRSAIARGGAVVAAVAVAPGRAPQPLASADHHTGAAPAAASAASTSRRDQPPATPAPRVTSDAALQARDQEEVDDVLRLLVEREADREARLERSGEEPPAHGQGLLPVIVTAGPRVDLIERDELAQQRELPGVDSAADVQARERIRLVVLG